MAFLRDIVLKTRHSLLYGLLLAVLVFGLKWIQWKFLIVDNSLDIYVGLIALFFTILGIGIATWLGRPRPQTIIIEKEIYVTQPDEFIVDETALATLNLSSREYEVLQLLAQGHSNADIAKQLFLSVSTVKTHVSNLFAKLDVKSRTQATGKAKRLKVIK